VGDEASWSDSDMAVIVIRGTFEPEGGLRSTPWERRGLLGGLQGSSSGGQVGVVCIARSVFKAYSVRHEKDVPHGVGMNGGEGEAVSILPRAVAKSRGVDGIDHEDGACSRSGRGQGAAASCGTT